MKHEPTEEEQLLARIYASRELVSLGYTRVDCPICRSPGEGPDGGNCYSCNGRGYNWQAPITK